MGELVAILLVLGLVAVIFVLPIAAFVRSGRAAREAGELSERIIALEIELARLRSAHEQELAALQATARASRPELRPAEPPAAATQREVREQTLQTPVPELPRPLRPRVSPMPTVRPTLPTPPMSAEPAPMVPPLIPPIPLRRPPFNFEKLKGSLNWEEFIGTKLISWIGGFALFLTVAYFVKYSFEHNLIPPEVRVALGFLVGIGLVVGGVVLRRKEYSITAHTLCATGIVILYAVTFACRAVYHFALFGPVPTFVLMTLVTATAFLLAIRLEAQVVALLGMLGGFLTPVLLSTGQDAPVALFGYIALLDAGMLAVARHRRWFYLGALAAAGTVIMHIGWAGEFFEREQYFLGNKVLIPMAILLFFNGLWLAATKPARSRK